MCDSYVREIEASCGPAVAYRALTAGFDKWWTDGCNPISKNGDKIVFRFGPSYWVMQAKNLVSNRLVELECIEAHHIHEGLPSSILTEWKGTLLKWEIAGNTEKVRIRLAHEGLAPALDCFEVCEQGWDHYFAGSLKKYLDTGKGSPFQN